MNTATPLPLSKSDTLAYLDQRMHALRLSNRDLAKAAGVTEQYVSRVLRGDRPVGPKIIDALNRLDPDNRIEKFTGLIAWTKQKE